MSDTALARLRLARTRRVGPVTYRQLVRRFGSASAALEALPDIVRKAGGQPFSPAPVTAVEREMARVAALGARYLFVDDPEYPPLLRLLDNAPSALILKGRAELLAGRMVAIVGARNASAAACRFARDIAQELGEAGLTVVSGLARGIDAAAHFGAAEGGATIAVLGCGIDVHFPPENAKLQQRLCEEQLVLTEQPPGTEPLARNFPHRNRIIAGLSLGTLVVEAAPRSGSLLTAKMAGDAGREVMAVPGSPLDPRAQGCNGLIREGATLVQSAADVIEALAPIDPGQLRPIVAAPELAFEAEGAEACEVPEDASGRIVSLLGPVAVSVDELTRQSGLGAGTVGHLLVDLELAGRVERHAGGRVALRA